MSEEKEKQDKLLAKLQWLTERSRLDFKGNPSPFEVKKTQQSVERAREHRARLQASDIDFLPFHHTKVPLALDATRTTYLRDLPHDQFDEARARQAAAAASSTYGPQRQRVDPETGLTEVQLALCWGPPNLRRQVGAGAMDDHAAAGCVCACHTDARGSRVGRTALTSSSSAPQGRVGGAYARLDPVTLGTLPVKERSQAYREEMLNYPKFTQRSVAGHSERWASGSQLAAPIVSPPSRRRAARPLYRVQNDGTRLTVERVPVHSGVTVHTRNPIRLRAQAQ